MRGPHSEATKAKMSAAQQRVVRVKRWKLPEADIVNRLLTTGATTRSIAAEYGCSDSTIKIIFRSHTTSTQRLEVKLRKQGETLKRLGVGNPEIWKHSNWKGRRHTATTREKQSLRKKGVRQPFDRRVAQSARLQGVAVDQWRGFAITENVRERKTSQLKEWRISVFSRDSHTCLMCRKRGGALHAHHVRPFASHPDLRVEVSNGATLCAEPCHKQTIGRESEYYAFFDALLLLGDRI